MGSDAIRITGTVRIPRSELTERFTTSGGPGGQHANRAATRVELVFDVDASEALRPVEKERIIGRLGPVVRIVADDERSQHRNRRLAEQRLVSTLADALRVRKNRRPTRRTRGSQERRLQAKRRRSDIKDGRRRPRHDD